MDCTEASNKRTPIAHYVQTSEAPILFTVSSPLTDIKTKSKSTFTTPYKFKPKNFIVPGPDL